MATIYKPTHKGKDGKRIRAKTWRIAYRDENGKRRTVGGYKDKDATLALARELETRAERISAGIPVVQKEKVREPLERVIQEYIDTLKDQGSAKDYIRMVRQRLETMRTACGWATLRDLSRQSIESFLKTIRAKGRSNATLRYYFAAARSFMNWCIQEGWLTENPLKNLRVPQSGAKGPTRPRRAFTEAELKALLEVAGPRRAVYAVAAMSGLRRDELRNLERGDVSFDPPTWHLRPEATKARRRELLPMLPDCVPFVRQACEEATSERVFTPPCIKTFHRDCRRAGIRRRDDRGRYLDFHSLRYTFCTMLAKVLPIQKVMILMRHRDIRLTANLYMDLGLTDLNAKDWKLPSFLTTSQPLGPAATPGPRGPGP